MPGTVNGIGTKYYGKAQHRMMQGSCESCGSDSVLESYLTMKYFTVLFVPLIPLGKFYVSNECSRCGVHRIISERKMNKLQAKNAQEVTAAVHSGAGANEILLEKLPYFIGYNNPELFHEVAATVLGSGSYSAPVYSMLGEIFSYFHNHDEAVVCYQKAIHLQNDEKTRAFLADALIHTGNSEKAELHVRPFLENANEEYYWVLLMLVEGYMSEGNHRKARELLTQMSETFTDEKFLPSLNHLKNEGEAYVNTTEKYYSAEIEKQKAPFYQGAMKLGIGTQLIGPGIALALFILYITSAITSVNDKRVYLTNGTMNAYEVNIDGSTYEIPSLGYKRIRLDEGTYTLTMESRDAELRSQQFTLKSNFFSRPFKTTEFVVNPDRQALIFTGEHVYGGNSSGDESPYTYYAGDLVNSFIDIDYSFTDVPDSIWIESNSATRYSLGMIDTFWNNSTAANYAARLLEPSYFKKFIGRYVTANPNDYEGIQLFLYNFGNDSTIAFLEPMLDDTPINIEMHRAYQGCMENAQREDELYTEYKARLGKDPDNATLLYLLGRVSQGDESLDYFKRSAAGEAPSAYAYNALAWHYNTLGEFSKAHPYIKKAQKLAPENATFQAVEVDLLLAQKKYSTLLQMTEETLKESPLDYSTMGNKVLYLSLLNREKAIKTTIDTYIEDLKAQNYSELDSYRDYLELQAAIAKGQRDEVKKLCRKMERYYTIADFFDKDFVKLDSAIAPEQNNLYSHLMLVATALKSNQQELAEKHFGYALNDLQKGDVEERQIYALLSKEQFSFEELNAIQMYPSFRPVLFAMVALKYPEHRAKAIQVVKKFNFEPTTTQVLVNELINS